MPLDCTSLFHCGSLDLSVKNGMNRATETKQQQTTN
jgi:hypothetical protein